MALYAKPPCPRHHLGFHQYVKIGETKEVYRWRCRLCHRRLARNKATDRVREIHPAKEA